MSDKAFTIGAVVILASVVGVCVAVSGGEDTPPVSDQLGFMQSVTSACDEHGNRLYSNSASGSLAVVGQDPTCKEK